MDQNDPLYCPPKRDVNALRLSFSGLAIQRLRVNNEIQMPS